MYDVQAFAQLLKAPHEETDSIIKERFPVPRLVVCDQYGSQVIFFPLSCQYTLHLTFLGEYNVGNFHANRIRFQVIIVFNPELDSPNLR